jgi:putative sterol carrier protein
VVDYIAGKCARAVSLLVDYMNKTKEVKQFVSGWESRIEFDLSGEKPFGVAFTKESAISFVDHRLENPDVVFYSNSELFFGMLTGKVDQDQAFSNGLVDIKGSIFDSVRFRHAAEITQEKHSALFTVLRAVSRFT